MAYDDFAVVLVKTKVFDGLFGYKAVGSSVEAILPYCVLLIVFGRNRITVCFRRHGLVECGIKYCYIRLARHQFHAGTDSHQVCRIVQRSKVATLIDNRDYFVVDDNGLCDLGTSVQYAVSDRLYLVQAL